MLQERSITFQMESAELETCQIREKLNARLRDDLKAYSNAVAALQHNIGKDFEEAHKRAESARVVYEASRQKLSEHIIAHGCA